MSSDHFYTTSEAERNHALLNLGYVDEGVECFVQPARVGPEGGFLVPLEGAVNLYRLYQPANGNHFYTTSEAERNHALLNLGWVDEGVECFVQPAHAGSEGGFLVPLEGAVNLYRLYDPATDDHLYTTIEAERSSALLNLGFKDEGIECFVQPARVGPAGGFLVPLEGAVNLYRLYRGEPPDTGDDGGNWFEEAVDGFSDAVRSVVDVAAAPANAVLEGAASAAERIEAEIPLVGGIIETGKGIATGVVSGAMNVPEIVMGWFGLRPKKYIKLLVVIQRDEQGEPIATLDTVLGHVNYAIGAFKAEANVDVLGVGGTNTLSDYVEVEGDASTHETLDVATDTDAFIDNITSAGPAFQKKMIADSVASAVPRLTGYGAPVIAFAVRKFDPSTVGGASLGPLADYITVDFDPTTEKSVTTLAHEMGHACNLTHTDEGLMKGDSVGRDSHLSPWQITKLRMSRHVIYF